MNKIIVLALTVILWNCSSPPAPEDRLPEGVGIILNNLDTTVSPRNDFFTYVNGGWISKTTIPADRGSWSAFSELSDNNNKLIRSMLDKAASDNQFIEGTDQRKAIDFYGVGMDSLSIERAGISPLKPILQKITGISNRLDLQNFLAEEELMDGDAFFKFKVSPDMKNSQKMAGYFSAGGIGLPERDFYFKTDMKSKETRDRYKQHVGAMLILSGMEKGKASRSAEKVLLIEMELARAMLSKEERRDPTRLYNKVSAADLSGLIPSINWKAYFLTLGVRVDSLIVTEPVFMRGYERVVNTFPMDDVKDYLSWTILRKSAPFLNNAMVTESFEFNARFLLGSKQLPPRWKRVLEVSNRYLGEAIGKLYVAEVFPPEAKMKAQEMVENIRFAFADRLKNLDWMSDSTKVKALGKLSAFSVKIGFPDKWRNYNGLVVEHRLGEALYYSNILNASRFLVKEEIGRLGQVVDKSMWQMTPQTVNASYNPQRNEIVFPAGILQPPFYDYRADDAVNYGGIGAAIGHEISHGFDDEGSRYDADGNLKNWWTEADLRKFREKGKALATQFDGYQPLAGLFVQGQFTLGENIGDLGGLNAAYDGLHRFYREHNLAPKKIAGMSANQRFFMSWATIWRAIYREEALRNQVLTNEHAPGMYRANGPPSNMPVFYEVFGVKPGDKMYREKKDRVQIW